MLTRRHIRVKVMQCIYALVQSKDDSLDKQLKFLKVSIDNMYVLYLLMLSLLAELHKLAEKHVQHASKKYLASEEEYPNPAKFVENKVLLQISKNALLTGELSKRKLNNWYLNEDYIKILYREIVSSSDYKDYMAKEGSTYDEDKQLVVQLFKNVIAPNDKIYEYFEDDKLTWVDDFPIVNTYLVKRLKKLDSKANDRFFLPRLLKDEQDMEYANQLLTKTLLNDAKWEKEIEAKTPNWDNDRIAEIDSIILKMAICELLNFPSIPEKVTLNEYLEIAKEYSTPKSSIFINGVLDKLAKEYKASGQLQKVGRGLQ
ncbi:transcription antitermination factor NusB [Flagellimonas allohymeniacidonis]|uniref:Transcription antitermination factor NusB n=1 Tax=Flagellimonas allohymeniacidonis TaxID=2517819 RepID=A0A4V2HSX7_9FLAO|nr:transcription antitermination factor NusB [Allomuricauda hymeniacidonis]TAI49420.1 transcription antitermination factor NusB [Allomuricauda hymeniacidonis]